MATVTAGLTAIGFVGGDMIRLFRNYFPQSVLVFGLAILAVVCGIVALAIPVRDRASLHFEEGLIGSGIAVFEVGFIGALSLLTYTASGAKARPTLKATLDISDGVAVDVDAKSNAVPSSERLQVLVYGYPVSGSDAMVIDSEYVGPDRDGLAEGQFHVAATAGAFVRFAVFAHLAPVSMPKDFPPTVASIDPCASSEQYYSCASISVPIPFTGSPTLQAAWDDSMHAINVQVGGHDYPPNILETLQVFSEVPGATPIDVYAATLAGDSKGGLNYSVKVPVGAKGDVCVIVGSDLDPRIRGVCPVLFGISGRENELAWF